MSRSYQGRQDTLAVDFGGVLALAEALSRDPPLQSLLLDGNQLMVRSVPEQLGLLDGVEALGRALGFNSTLTHVSLRDNVIKTRGAEALAAGLALNRSVRSLDVRENFMHGRGAPALAATAVSHPALLSFSGIPLDKLRANAAQCLDLGGMKVGTPGFLALSRVLPDCRSLTTLVLDDTWEADRRGSREMQSARKQVMQALGGALKETSTLTALSLRGNALNPECAAMLAAGLAASRALTSLDLSDNALGEAASEDDTRSFRMQHPDLSVYPGRDVPFCASGGKADHGDSSGDDTPPLLEFAEAVATNGTLRTVDLLGNQIKERGIELLLGAVRRTALLPSVCGIPPEATEADLSRRELTPYDAMLLAAELELRGEVSMRELATRAMAHTETTGASTAVSEGGAPWTLTALNLAHNRIFLTGEEHDPRVASRLADILAQEMDGGALTSLNLWGNHMSCADAEALVGAVRQRRLRMKLCGDLLDAVDVDLHQKQRTVAKVILVANDLALEPVVQSLDLSAEMQGFHTTSSERNEDIVALAGALVFNHRLTTLDLSGINIGPHGVKALARALTPNEDGASRISLQTLVLDDCNLARRPFRQSSYDEESPEKIELLSEALADCSLTALSLQGNVLGPKCLEALTRGLILPGDVLGGRALHSLDIRRNGCLDEDGCEDPLRRLASAIEAQPERWVTVDGVPLRALKTGSMTDLDLRDCKISFLGALLMSHWLAENRTVRTVNLLRNVLESPGAQSVMAMFEKSDTLETLCGLQADVEVLDLSSGHLRPWDAVLLAADIRKGVRTKRLHTLRLEGNAIGTDGWNPAVEGFGALGRALQDSPSLARLDLSRNQMRSAGAEVFAPSLQHAHALCVLALAGNELGAAGVKVLMQSLGRNGSLMALDLQDNKIGLREDEENRTPSDDVIDGFQAVADLLKLSTCLQELNLSKNSMGPKGALALAEGLAQTSSVKELCLNSNMLVGRKEEAHPESEEGMAALGNALRTNQSLATFSLRDNVIGPKGAAAFASGLVDNKTLTTLDISGETSKVLWSFRSKTS
eukprot:gene11539-13635_t